MGLKKRDLWDSNKRCNIPDIRVLEEEEREDGAEKNASK